MFHWYLINILLVKSSTILLPWLVIADTNGAYRLVTIMGLFFWDPITFYSRDNNSFQHHGRYMSLCRTSPSGLTPTRLWQGELVLTIRPVKAGVPALLVKSLCVLIGMWVILIMQSWAKCTWWPWLPLRSLWWYLPALPCVCVYAYFICMLCILCFYMYNVHFLQFMEVWK